ncbi:hypothetical protein BRC81_10455 [Halobacteriales archaeon QS_1_68_20]|nr:MAG: hypothetical protein BRC81_10455 [Halobacteriales archaeon QS_1_68_20]
MSLLFGGATIAVGGYALLNDRPRLSLTGVAGYLVLRLTFTADLYSMLGARTTLVVPLGFAPIVAAMAATWTFSARLTPR